MSAPFLLFLVTAILALIALILRRRIVTVSAISSVGAVLIAGFALWANLDEPFVVLGVSIKLTSTWRILGRALTLDEGNRAAVGFLYLAGAFIFGGAWIARPSGSFFFVGSLSLGVVAASLLIRPFLFAAIFMELAAMGAVLILVSPERPALRGGLRLLILYTLAMMTILITGWMLESVGVTSATPTLALRAKLLLAFGFSALVAVPPFHIWLPAAANQSNSYSLAFVTVILQGAGLFFMLRFFDSYAWLREDESLFTGIRVAGAAMIWLGSLWAVAQSSFSKSVAYALLADFGVMLLAVGAGTLEGFQLALGLTGVRVVSMVVLGLGMTLILRHPGENEESQLKGIWHKFPLAAISVLVGFLSIAGFPLTAGFPGRWALLATLAPIDPLTSLSILVAFTCLGATFLRWMAIFLQGSNDKERRQLPFAEKTFVVVGIALCLILGVFPQLLYPWVVEAAAGMAQLLP